MVHDLQMKLGIMQPYLFPYIGYFQLISAVDKFIIYDDVSYIKQGWINRNRILLNGKAFLFTLHLSGASSFKLINEIELANNRDKLLKTFKQAYVSAPFFNEIYPIIEKIFTKNDNNLSRFLINSIFEIVKHIKINTQILISSQVRKNNDLKGQEKIIDICRNLGVDHYINAIGGMELYSRDRFERGGIKLSFIKSKPISYKQFNNDFVSWLSIIDVMMFSSREQIQEMLNAYELI